MNASTSGVWKRHEPLPDGPAGLTIRTTFPPNPEGVEVMLECWDAGTDEPPHSHPGDDMTVVVEGRMEVQFFKREAGVLVPDGGVLTFKGGETAYVPAGRIHDAKYVEACKLVYVHDRAFAFNAEV